MYEPKFEALGQKREVSRKKRDMDKLKKKLHGENKLKCVNCILFNFCRANKRL